jgi:eukaryotic-like serine/threonine-protein kinase
MAMEQFTSGRYEIKETLGRGGMGCVYKAIDKLSGRTVAIKVMEQESLVRSKDVRRFEREVVTASNLHHSAIARVLGSGVGDNGQPFLVMEYVEGETLAQCLATMGQLPLDFALKIFIQLCDALAYAHSK